MAIFSLIFFEICNAFGILGITLGNVFFPIPIDIKILRIFVVLNGFHKNYQSKLMSNFIHQTNRTKNLFGE